MAILLIQQPGQRLYKENWRAAGFSGVIVYGPVHFHRVVRDSIKVLWLVIRVTVMCSQTHCLNPFQPVKREQAGSTGYYYTHLASPLRDALSQ